MNATPEQAAYSACLPGAAAVHLVFGFQLSRHTVFISVSGGLLVIQVVALVLELFRELFHKHL